MWEEWLQEMLCRVLKRLGGDCKDLENETPDEQVADVNAVYLSGAKPFLPTPDAKAKFLADLDALEIGMAAPGCTLSPEGCEMLLSMIEGLRAEVIG